MRAVSRAWVAAAMCAVVVLGALVAPAVAAAQEVESEPLAVSVVEDDDAADAAEPFDARATESTVDRVRRTLIAIAVVTGIGLVVFWWHTSPARRLRIATQRAADQAMPQD